MKSAFSQEELKSKKIDLSNYLSTLPAANDQDYFVLLKHSTTSNPVLDLLDKLPENSLTNEEIPDETTPQTSNVFPISEYREKLVYSHNQFEYSTPINMPIPISSLQRPSNYRLEQRLAQEQSYRINIPQGSRLRYYRSF